MTNVPDRFLNSTLIPLTPFRFSDCIKEVHLGFIFFHCVMAFCVLLGIPANLWCIWFYNCKEQKGKQSHVFLLNHIITELIFCLECAAEILNMYILKNDTFSTVIGVFISFSWSERPLMQTCMCIEQYFAVIHPIIFLRYKGIKYRIAVIVAVWFISLGYTWYRFTIINFIDPVIISMFIITLAVTSFCCISVLCALKHPGPGEAHTRNQTGRDAGNQQKRNAFKTIISALILILFTYVPQALLTIVTLYKIDQILLTCNISPFVTSFNFIGVVITPLMKMYKGAHVKCRNQK